MFSIPLHWVTSRGHASPEKSKSCLHVHVLICILYYIIMFYPAVNWHGHGKMDRLPKGKPSLAQIYASWPQGVCIYIYVCVYNMLHAYIYIHIYLTISILYIYICVCVFVYLSIYVYMLSIYLLFIDVIGFSLLTYLLCLFICLLLYWIIYLFVFLSLSLCPRACVHVYVGVCESAWSLLLLLCVTMGIISMITVSLSCLLVSSTFYITYTLR